MSAPLNLTPVERAERLLGIGEPKPCSQSWVAYSVLLSAVCLAAFWYSSAWVVVVGALWAGAIVVRAAFRSVRWARES